MKKTLLFYALLLQAGLLLGQGSLQLFDEEGNQFVNGQNTYVLIESVEGETVSPELFVKNISDRGIEIKIRVQEVLIPENGHSYFCGLGNCFPIGTLESVDPYAIAAGELVGPEGFFSAHYTPNETKDDAIIRYTFFNVDDLSDTISVNFTFSTSSGTNDIFSNATFNAYPNPAQDRVSVDVSGFDINEGVFELYNALGKLAYVQSYFGESTLNIDLANLPRGMYLYRVVSKGNHSASSKLVLR